jgi:uncharacterized short protein YbdD (DUF466 family)
VTARGAWQTRTLRRATRAMVAQAGRVGAVVRQLLGVPDYERYLAHMRERHPGVPPLSAREFHRQRLDERYGRPGSRCC